MRKIILAAAALAALTASPAFALTEGESNNLMPGVVASGFGKARADVGFIPSGQYNNPGNYGDDFSPAATSTRRAVTVISPFSVTYSMTSSNG